MCHSTQYKKYTDFVKCYWTNVIHKCGFGRWAKKVTIGIDKPAYLSDFTHIIHSERKQKSKNTDNLPLPTGINDDDTIPHGTDYQVSSVVHNILPLGVAPKC